MPEGSLQAGPRLRSTAKSGCQNQKDGPDLFWSILDTWQLLRRNTTICCFSKDCASTLQFLEVLLCQRQSNPSFVPCVLGAVTKKHTDSDIQTYRHNYLSVCVLCLERAASCGCWKSIWAQYWSRLTAMYHGISVLDTLMLCLLIFAITRFYVR